MAEKTNVPEIRFAGFTDPWEQRKLGDVATRHDNLRIPITAKDRIPGDTPYYGANGIQDYVEGYTHEGEFVLVAEDGATDLDNYPVQLISGLSWVNNHAHVIKAIPDLAQNRFIMHLIKSMDIASYLVGGTRSKLNAEVLMGIELKLPSNSEQIYIGTLLSTLDSLITLHQRKYDKLCAVKKSMLDKMFPKPGEIEPEIRFAGFTDPWEQRKLGDVANIKTGDSDLQDAVPNGLYPFFVRSDKVERSNRYLFDGEAILVPGEGRLGEIFHYINGKFDYHQRVYKISNFVDVDAKFAMYSMMYGFKKHALENTAKATVDSIRLPTLTEFKFRVPCRDEQHQINVFFSRLDSLITLHQREPPHMMKEGKNANQYQRRIPFL